MKKIKRIIKRILCFLLPLRKIIVFESVPAFSDNTRAVFDEMIRRGVNKKYKMVWFSITDDKMQENIENVDFVNTEKDIKKVRYYKLFSRALISCNCFVRPRKKRQFSIYLSHGTGIKSTRNHYNVPAEIDRCLVAGEGAKKLMAYEFRYDENKIISLGFPRNDALTNSTKDVKSILQTSCDKVVVWYPTFRQHKSDSIVGAKSGVPIIHNTESAFELNEKAKELNILIVLKPHFAQDLAYIKDLGLSNIRFIDDEFYVKNKISSYEFVGGCDSLISDYSSVYYDYTLCDKPIGVIWEDIEEYKQAHGLVDNYEYYLKGAEKIYTLSDFTQFLERVSNGEDALRDERREIRDKMNYSTDGRNSERVVDYILSQINYK